MSKEEAKEIKETNETKEIINLPNSETMIRVLIDENPESLELTIDNPVYVYTTGMKQIAYVKKGNLINVSNEFDNLRLKIADKEFGSTSFLLTSPNEIFPIEINGKKLKGNLKLEKKNGSLILVNEIPLESYVKGVLASEMPIGKGRENFESLKALAICARTYASRKIIENKSGYDIYSDVRDQVYKGDNGIQIISDAVDQTKGMILTFNSEAAIIYYHSTCGGRTEDSENVFTQYPVPYLKSIVDGYPKSNCSISPRYKWDEFISGKEIINRLSNAKLISNQNYVLYDVEIISRFESGRVNELRFYLNDSFGLESEKSVYGNEIRSVIRNSDNSGILRSTLFDINFEKEKGLTLTGKGFGHGVGLCQYGAIYQSRIGKTYEEIINFYYPGTKIKLLND